MDFRFSAEDEAFRQEVRDFLHKELGANWIGFVAEMAPEEFEFDIHMRKRLAARGWLTMAWPKEYGGAGATMARQMIFAEEMAYFRAPGRDNQGIGMVGPCLMIHGTEEQRREHLPRIAGGDVIWCQGFSEPGSGSDLASLRTRAVRDGDDYIINGQKVWTTYAHRADWMHVLTRTDPEAPKHKGITYFMLDMKTPGIDVRPLINMADGHGFNEVFFNNVRVPAKNMLGPENRGWYVATTTLDFERTAVGIAASTLRMLDDAMKYFKSLPPDRNPMNRPVIKHRMAERYIEVQIGRLYSFRVGWMHSQGRVPNMEASMARMFSTEVTQRVAATLMEALGLQGQMWQKGPNHGRRTFPTLASEFYLATVRNTIAGGTREIQRNVIATRGLGLPR